MSLIHIENAQYSVSGALHYDELFIRDSPSTYYHQPTCINALQDSYLLAPKRSRMLVVTSAGVWLQLTFLYKAELILNSDKQNSNSPTSYYWNMLNQSRDETEPPPCFMFISHPTYNESAV